MPHNHRCVIVTLLVLALAPASVRSEDWPVWQHDNQRSGSSGETLKTPRLGLAWQWRSPFPPQPAWAGPAKWDAYADLKNLPAMRNYDAAFQVIAVADSIFFGSSTDDTLYCLHASTGKERWSYVTDGPIRIAPSASEGRIYFGSDDGFAYCLDSSTGALIWKFRPADPGLKIVNNGRFISPYPCRTGILVHDGKAYFSCGLLPWKESYLCAVNAENGLLDEPGCYVQRLGGKTLEGAPAVTSDLLVFPQGRVAPQLYRRRDGHDLGQLKKSGGGSIVVVALESVLHGPATDSRRGGIRSSDPKTREAIASYGRGNALAVSGSVSYMLTDDQLVASELKQRQVLWKVPCDCPHSLITAQGVLFAGGLDKLAAFSAADGRRLWSRGVQGRVMGLALSGGRLFASTDQGLIYAFAQGAGNENRRTAAASEPRQRPSRTSSEAAELAVGPWAQFTQPGKATVYWTTRRPSPTVIEYETEGQSQRYEDARPKVRHHARLSGLALNRVYRYVIRTVEDDQLRATQPFELDTFFDYTIAPLAPGPTTTNGAENTRYAAAAETLLARSGIDRGLCLVLGSAEGRLAWEIARRSRLRVVGVDADYEAVVRSRDWLRQKRAYGGRVTVHHVADLGALPFVGHVANLIVSERALAEGTLPGTADEVFRLLRPDGGVALWGQTIPASLTPAQVREFFSGQTFTAEVTSDESGVWGLVRRDKLPGAGDWTHLYGRPDNSAFAGERLGGASGAAELDVQWVGRPGPRYQSDRSGRKPSPLSTAGRLFLQGLDRMLAVDAFNGTLLWSLEIPDLRRFNVARDCGNWCADRNHVYLAIRDQCWQIDAATGAVTKTYAAEPDDTKHSVEWGYVARHQGKLLGSAVRRGSSWKDYWGKEGWYDARSGPVTHQVCSDQLFALDPASGLSAWNRSEGVILNSTITVADGVVYCFECRNPKVLAAEQRRVGHAELWQDQFMVALDLQTGALLWERPVDTADGSVAFYLAHAQDQLIAVSSNQKKYDVYSFSDADGAQQWHQSFGWLGGKGDHGKALSRPAIVGDLVYVRPRVLNIKTGELLDKEMPAGGCGTYACSEYALFFRSQTVTMWDRHRAEASSWTRLRPDCWLSTIPANGMLLSPEGGGGCSCGNWMETSIGFMPLAHRQTPLPRGGN